MIFVFILVATIMLILLVGARYKQFIQYLAIILAFVALIPYCISIYYYFSEGPDIKYSIVFKTKHKQGNGYIYEFSLAVNCSGGSAIMNYLYLSPEKYVFPISDPRYDEFIKNIHILSEAEDRLTARINLGGLPSFKGSYPMYQSLRFSSNENKDIVNLLLTVDAEIDPYKQGVLSIFKKDYYYRYFADIPIDFSEGSEQIGFLRRRY